MKTLVSVFFCACLVFPLSSIAQKTTPNESSGQVKFSSNYTTTCNSQLLVKFTDESIPPPNDYTTNWTWIFGDGRTSNDWNPDYRYTSPGVYTVKLIIKTNAGVIDSFTRVDYIQVGTPIVKLGKDTSICEGSSIVFDAGHQNTGASYLWNTGDTTQKLTASEPGKYYVTVKWNGCEASDTVVLGSRPGIFPSFGFDIDGTCLPTKVKFTDSSFICPGNSIIQWKWEFGDGTTSLQQHPQHVYTTADTFNVRLTIWDNNGFSMTRSKRVIVNSVPGPIVNLGNDTTVCEVMPFVLDAGNPDATFTWSTGDIYQSCVITSSGEVWVRVEQNGCVATDTINIKLIPTLTPQFGFQTFQANCPVKVVFTDSSKTCGVNIVQWDWDFGDGNFSHEQHPSHEYTENGEYVVRLTVHDDIGNNVTRSKRLYIQSSTVKVNLGKDTTVCFGNSITLDAGITNASYLWSTGETTKEISIYDAGDYWVRVQKGTCFGYDTIRVGAVFPINPGFDFTVQGKCLPVEVKFEDKSIVGCGQQIVQWKWTFGDGATSTEKNPTHTYYSADSFAVRLTVITNEGMSISKSRKVYIQNTPPVANAGNNLTICIGDIVQLDAGVDSASYSWTPAQSLDNNSIQRPMASPSQTTTYTVAVTKCMTTSTDQVTIFINTLDRPSIRVDGPKIVSTTGKSYQWYRDGQLVKGATGKTIKPDAAGNYKVKIKNSRGCLVESSAVFFVPAGRNDKVCDGIRVICTPNPSPGVVYVILSKLPTKPIAVTVVDRYGQRLYTTTVSNHRNMLNLSKLAKGHYSVELIVNNEKVAIPIILH